MIINRLILKNFGKFQGKEIELKEGINILFGENESGKSTIHVFLQSMLFGMKRGRGKASKTIFTAVICHGKTGTGMKAVWCLPVEKERFVWKEDLENLQKRLFLSVKQTERYFPWSMEIWTCFWEALQKIFMKIQFP